MIKSEFLIMTGMVWPVSSNKWKAPLHAVPYLVFALCAPPFTFLPHPLSLEPLLNDQTFVAYLPR